MIPQVTDDEPDDEAHRIQNNTSVLSQTVRTSSLLLCARRRRARIACAWRRILPLPHPPPRTLTIAMQ